MSGYYDNYPNGLDFVKDVAGSTLGFANRNEESSHTGLTWPNMVSRLGMNFAKMLEAPNRVSIDQRANPAWLSTIRAPGIIVFDIDPIFAPQRGDGTGIADENVHYSEETYNSLYSYLRLYDAAVGDIQAVDIAAIDYGNMLLRYYLSFFMKVLRAVNTALTDNNNYQNARVILRALGFAYDAEHFDDLTVKLPSYIKKVNQWVLSITKLVRVLVNTFPGAKRLPALITEWYRDVETETAYAQMYTFKPKHWWTLSYYVGDENKHCWNIVKSDMPTTIADYVDKLIDMMRVLFQDDSAIQVQRYLNKVVDAGAQMPGGVSVTTSVIDFIPTPDPEAIGYDAFESKFDRDMLLAIQNATICTNWEVGDAIQIPGKVKWQQNVSSDPSFWGDTVARFTKPLNLPWRDATYGDFYNAIQWMIIRHKEAAWNDYTQVDPKVLGTDIIVDAYMWELTGDDVYDPSVQGRRIQQIIAKNVDNCIIPEDIALLSRLRYFDHAPMIYVLEGFNRANYRAGTVTDVLTQGEAFFITDYESLASLKPEFVKNYWGFPFVLDSIGTFSTHHVAGTSFGLDTAKPTEYTEYTESRDFDNPGVAYDRRGNSAISNKNSTDKRTNRSQAWKNKNKGKSGSKSETDA
jgi:hypothetical protein